VFTPSQKRHQDKLVEFLFADPASLDEHLTKALPGFTLKPQPLIQLPFGQIAAIDKQSPEA